MSSSSRYCPICGGKGANTLKGHRCRESVLRAIDAANTRAGDEELAATGREPLWRTERRRLAEGFNMMGDDYEPG